MTTPTPSEEELREKLWELKFGQPIKSSDLRSLDHYPHLHKSFFKLEAFIAAHTKATRKQVVAEVRGRMPEIPFVSFEQCRTTADYNERQALRKLLDQINKTLDEMEAEDAKTD